MALVRRRGVEGGREGCRWEAGSGWGWRWREKVITPANAPFCQHAVWSTRLMISHIVADLLEWSDSVAAIDNRRQSVLSVFLPPGPHNKRGWRVVGIRLDSFFFCSLMPTPAVNGWHVGERTTSTNHSVFICWALTVLWALLSSEC